MRMRKRKCAPMKIPDMPAAIAAPTNKDKPFPIRGQHTVYEAAMVYAGRHPYEFEFGPYDTRDRRERCLTRLKVGLAEKPHKRPRAQRSWDIFCELGERIKSGRIKPIRIRRDLHGNIDFVDTVIATAELVKLAIERDEQPKYLRHLLGETANIPPSAAAVKLTEPNKASQKRRTRRRGPRRGSVGRNQADRALFPEMDRLRLKHGSAHAAALILVDEGRVDGWGARESKAKRLAARYLRARRRSIKLAETH